MTRDVSVIIPVHNSVFWLTWCLDQLIRCNDQRILDVIVVNDRSNMDQESKLVDICNNFADVNLIHNREEIGGFGFACNLGAKLATGKNLFFLNTDCLITSGTVAKLADALNNNENIALSCPVSNNSPDLTYPIFPGRSFIDMSHMVTNAFIDSASSGIYEACTIVGNALMVKRAFFEKVEGFSPEWGIGYGEETDLHMKALSLGYKGVVDISVYVYHFGGGSFNHLKDIEKHRQENYALFMSKWRNEYLELKAISDKNPPIEILSKNLEQYFQRNEVPIDLDILFYLPSVDQTIGGLNAVISICNELILKGIKAGCALVGISSALKLPSFKEPVFFNFLQFPSDEDFIRSNEFSTKIVVSTIFTSSIVCARYAQQHSVKHVQFIQGFEPYFENGLTHRTAVESYGCSEDLIATTDWLTQNVGFYLQPNQTITKLPLIVNKSIFFRPVNLQKKYDICMVLRGAPDKGQWILLNVIRHIVKENYKVAVISSASYLGQLNDIKDEIDVFEMPLSSFKLAEIYRSSEIFIDASIHEGFGLMPYEAYLCGCKLVLNDSGGVSEFINQHDSILKSFGPYPEQYLDAISLARTYIYQGLDSYTAGISDWVNYVETKSDNVFYKKSDDYTTFKDSPAIVNSYLQRTYMKLRPKIPNRIHNALRALIKGGK